MRGLKQLFVYQAILRSCRIFYRCVDWNPISPESIDKSEVASFTDAWIETDDYKNKCNNNQVASFTDAWIETLDPLIAWIMK